MNIIIDIETIPSQRPGIRDELAADIKPPAALKKAKSIAEWERESKPAAIEEAYLRTSLDGGAGQICCIGWVIDYGPAKSLSVADASLAEERELLADFFGVLRQAHGNSGMRPIIVGHNVVEFDLAFIWRRAIVHGVRPPIWFPRDPKPWSESVFDTMTSWAGVRNRISMDKLCRILGIDGKGDGPTGADVWPMFQAGRLADIADYCRADVERTRAIYRRLTFTAAE